MNWFKNFLKLFCTSQEEINEAIAYVENNVANDKLTKLKQLADTIKSKIVIEYQDPELALKINDMLPKVDWEEEIKNLNFQTTDFEKLEIAAQEEFFSDDDLLTQFEQALESDLNFATFVGLLKNEGDIYKKEIIEKLRKMDAKQAKALLIQLS